MKYQEFLYAIEAELNKKLEEGVKASVYTAQKNNGREKKGILFQKKELSASPAIYLEGIYARLQKGEQMDRLVQEVLKFYETVGGEEVWDYNQIKEYDKIRDKIIFKLIHTDKNKKMLECIPSVEVLDLSIVFYVLLEMDKTGTATIQISNEHLKMWEISKEEIYHVALKNAKTLLPAEFFTMQHAIETMLEVASGEEENLLNPIGEEKEDVMYVLTNSLRNYGAACLLYPHVLDIIGEMLKEDFFILPSSIHEAIIVPESRGLDTEEMNEMVVEINETQVAPEEILSNHVYFYRRQGRELMLSK